MLSGFEISVTLPISHISDVDVQIYEKKIISELINRIFGYKLGISPSFGLLCSADLRWRRVKWEWRKGKGAGGGFEG